MSDVKQVKVDNWGIYFLQRLKHFFNRTDYCDLTLQFQDNAQLKVHRLVLSACTEYFELLERTCEMYEDCLVMPDDLQADVVVPIVNFMYTGHLEFRMDLLERLYQTSQILNMPVLTKLLESHRQAIKSGIISARSSDLNYSGVKHSSKTGEHSKSIKPMTSSKRSYSKAFDNSTVVFKDKKVYHSVKVHDTVNVSQTSNTYCPTPPPPEPTISNKRSGLVDPRPTRYELPEELDQDNIFDNSFCNVSYTCKPLMIHPENIKSYSSKRSGIFSEASTSKKLLPGTSTLDIVECKRIARQDNIYDDSMPDHIADDIDLFQTPYSNETTKDSSQLFDQILDDGPKVTIESKDSKAASNLDHAKIISEVLKKYPHLVKSNKNIKLKILNTPAKTKKIKSSYIKEELKSKPKLKTEEPDYTYETDVLDSQQAAKLIAMGAENVKGPWICLICGTPGKALHFTSYYKFRRHLVEVHHEKPVSNICEYCGLRSLKRNYLLHHLYSQHGVEPPPQYNFPKCNRCNYIALTEGLLVKHKMTHANAKIFRCNVCSKPFDTSKLLLQHIQITGHKYSAERKTNFQCIYCLKSFLRDGNLFAHLKTYHKKEAKHDGIIEDSDDEKPEEQVASTKHDREGKYHHVKFEPNTSFENEFVEMDVQYQIQENRDGDIQLTPRKQHNLISNSKQKILNPGFSTPKTLVQKAKQPVRISPPEASNFLEDINIPSPLSNNHNGEEIVLIDNVEYIMRDNHLIPRKQMSSDYIIPDIVDSATIQTLQPTTSMGYTEVNKIIDGTQANIIIKKNKEKSDEFVMSEIMDSSASIENVQASTSMDYTEEQNTSKLIEGTGSSIIMNKTTNINQPIQIVVSNEEEYKALISSNHPILFDNGGENKTLTMLTAPHNATIESTTLDLENAQSNEMMIIQENYPLNVTEAVSTNNSNIVVVYSHPVDDQNKQYQILTTDGIGSQFVQSSAIITQNYETVTTTAPVMSAHVLEPQPVTTWQEAVQSAEIQQVPLESASEVQNVENVQGQDQLEHDTNNELAELPEVHLTSDPITTFSQAIQSNDDANNLNIIHKEQTNQLADEIQDETQNSTEVQMQTDISRESVAEEEKEAVIEPLPATEECEKTAEPNIVTSEAHQELTVEELRETESIAEETNTETHISQELPTDIISTPEISQVPENNDHSSNKTLEEEQPLQESQAYDEIVEINHNVNEQLPPVTKEAEVKIQNLTSEWSEDEYDVPENTNTAAPTVQAFDISKDTDAIAPVIEETEHIVSTLPTITQPDPDELEETIENIQNEVQNHLASKAAKLSPTLDHLHNLETKECENINAEETSPNPQEAPVSCEVGEVPVPQQIADIDQNEPQTQENISSLLNDWEDNDSQEENTQNIISTVEKKKALESEETLDNNTLKTNSKTDNIKSLVSDWDEDDEEVKNE